MDVVIIGSGNVASVLGKKILSCGHTIVAVLARNEKTGKQLASRLNASYSNKISGPYPQAQVYIAAVSDDALPVLGRQLDLQKAVLVHTAGSVPMEVLKHASTNYGVLYPLQTLKAENEEIPEFPLLVDANTPDTLTLIRDFADTISNRVVVADDHYRSRIHMAAVISGNFSNHLFALVQDYCRENELDFSLLLPHIHQIVQNLDTGLAANRQTGPAVRNDVATLKMHLDMLESYPRIRKVYELFTSSILNYNNKKDHS